MVAILISLVVILGIIAVIALFFFGSCLDDFNTNCGYSTVRMKWSMVKNLMAVAPERWVLEEDYIAYNIKKPGHHWETKGIYPSGWCMITLSLVDYLRYQAWYYKREAKIEEDTNNKLLVTILGEFQKDTTKAIKDAQAQIDKANSMMKEVIENGK